MVKTGMLHYQKCHIPTTPVHRFTKSDRFALIPVMWWLFLGFKGDLVCAPVNVLWIFAKLETGGTLEGHCCGRGRSSFVAMIAGCKLFCSLLLFQWCSCYACECTPVGVDLGCYVEFRRLDATPFQTALQCVLVALLWPALFSLSLC